MGILPALSRIFRWGGLPWCLEADLLRRGGFRRRKNMLANADEIRALINELRGKNRKIIGEQPMKMVSCDKGASGGFPFRMFRRVIPLPIATLVMRSGMCVQIWIALLAVLCVLSKWPAMCTRSLLNAETTNTRRHRGMRLSTHRFRTCW